MSYLNSLRLHFFGQFQAAVSTVNNDPTHFNNATFKPAYQQRPGGWWNPRGDANWRMIGCNITSAWLSNGQPAAADDPVLTCLIADSDRTVAAKLVDLDPYQQGVSEIWGMEIRIANGTGRTLMRANYKTAAFMDIFQRLPGATGDGSACALYQSVLADIDWGNVGDSPFLQQLQNAASDGLSIKFNVDAFDANYQSPTFTLGRVAGTIGPAEDTEPHQFVIGRHLMTTALPNQGFFLPAGGVNFCQAVVDEPAGKIYLDLGNSLPTATMGGPFQNLGVMSLACATTDASGNTKYLPLGNVDYLADGWYQKTAGVVALPTERKLGPDELNTVASNPLAILLAPSGKQPTPAISEPDGGLYVRADQFVFRLNPGEGAEIHLYGSAYGKPLSDARVINFLDATQIGGGPGLPPVGVPEDALEFPRSVVLNEFGQARVPVSARNPGNPRSYIDGQVYGIRCVLEDTLAPPLGYPFDPSEFVSLLVWDEFTANPPVWYGCLQPVFQQYANLYPIMSRFVDLANYESVTDPDNLIPLSITFGLGLEDPNAMPVTRDLSGGKRKAILQWLNNPGPNGKPLKGTLPPAAQAAPEMAEATPSLVPEDPRQRAKVAFYARVRSTRRQSRP